jgi:FMN phosphatase YigB (HAD superfamily)
MTKFVAGYLGIPAGEAEERLPVPVHTTLFVDDVVQYLLPFRDLGGMIVHMATPGFGTNEIPTISTLRDLVSIIYPDRSRG